MAKAGLVRTRWTIARKRSRMFVALGAALLYAIFPAFELIRLRPAVLVQLTGTVNVVVLPAGTVMVNVALIAGENVPPVTPLIVIESPVFRPCAPLMVIVAG